LCCAVLVAGFGVRPAGASDPTLRIGNTAVVEGASPTAVQAGAATATFAVTLSPASASTVTVSWATADGSAKAPADYLAASGSVTFAPGETSKPVQVTVVDDTAVEGSQTFKVLLSGAVGATVADGTGVATIFDDDQYTITLGSALSDVVVDPASKFAYATNPQLNEVEVVNL